MCSTGWVSESDPCLVCNCPDAPTQVTKLTAIKTDAKYTSNSQLYKLAGAFVIDKIVLKVTELKRAKMVKTITVYYSNIAVDNIVELKNNMAAWKKVCHKKNSKEIIMDRIITNFDDLFQSLRCLLPSYQLSNKRNQ